MLVVAVAGYADISLAQVVSLPLCVISCGARIIRLVQACATDAEVVFTDLLLGCAVLLLVAIRLDTQMAHAQITFAVLRLASQIVGRFRAVRTPVVLTTELPRRSAILPG